MTVNQEYECVRQCLDAVKSNCKNCPLNEHPSGCKNDEPLVKYLRDHEEK